MATDPFNDVLSPRCGEFVEIGQPTFVELLWARRKQIRPAIGKANPDVRRALTKLAFGKKCEGVTSDPSGPPKLIAAPPSESEVSTQKYALNKLATQNPNVLRIQNEFQTLVSNEFLYPSATPVISPQTEDCKIDLAIVLDDTGSMINFLIAMRNGAQDLLDAFLRVGSGLRLALVTFKSDVDSINARLPFTSNVADFFQVFLPIPAIGGNDFSWSASATIATVGNHAGSWREDAVRAMILITNSANDVANGESATSAANFAKNPGPPFFGDVQVAYMGTVVSEANVYEAITGAPHTIVDELAFANNLVPAMVEYIDSLSESPICDSTPPPSTDCSPNLIFNNDFAVNASGWTHGGMWDGTFESSAPADPISNGSLRLTGSSSAEQIIKDSNGAAGGLTPGNILSAQANWCVNGAIGAQFKTEFVDSAGDVIPPIAASGTIGETLITNGQSCSSDRANRTPLQVIVPNDGWAKLRFTLIPVGNTIVHFDNVTVCELAGEICGGGFNHVQNGEFNAGVEPWLDWAGTPLTNNTEIESGTGILAWDSDAQALNVPSGSRINYNLEGLIPGNDYTLQFDLLDLTYIDNPADERQIGFFYIIEDSSNQPFKAGAIQKGEIYNVNSNSYDFPHRLLLDFTAPDDGIITIRLQSVIQGLVIDGIRYQQSLPGIGKIDNISICGVGSDICDPEYNKIFFNDFVENGRGGWVGGDHTSGKMTLHFDNQTMTTNVSFGSVENADFTWKLTVHVQNNSQAILTMTRIKDNSSQQIITPEAAGFYTLEFLTEDVDPSETLVVSIQWLDICPPGCLAPAGVQNPDTEISTVLLCSKQLETTADCLAITDTRVVLNWDGIPRDLVNIFNVLTRFTLRNLNDPADKKTITQQIDRAWWFNNTAGTASCDYWVKNHLTNPDLVVFDILNQVVADAIVAGDVDDIQSTGKWNWSIPYQNRDAGVGSSNWPVPDLLRLYYNDLNDAFIIESIEVLVLANRPDLVKPVDNSAECVDPGTELTITLDYKNSGDERQFKKTIPIIDILEQEIIDPEPPLWDAWDLENTHYSINGIKGTNARWESFNFLLDTVDGKGIDQCTSTIISEVSGSGNLDIGNFSISGRGQFIESCEAKILIEDLSAGSNQNEIQSIALPFPSAGTWTLKFTGLEEIISIPWDADADQLRVKIGGFTNVGGTRNVEVTGAGTPTNPFMVEFVDLLAATDMPLLIADGTGLKSSLENITVESLWEGSDDQDITIGYDIYDGFLGVDTSKLIPVRNRLQAAINANDTFTLVVKGIETIPIRYDASFNDVVNALSGVVESDFEAILIGDIAKDVPLINNLLCVDEDDLDPFLPQNYPHITFKMSFRFSDPTIQGIGINPDRDILIGVSHNHDLTATTQLLKIKNGTTGDFRLTVTNPNTSEEFTTDVMNAEDAFAPTPIIKLFTTIQEELGTADWLTVQADSDPDIIAEVEVNHQNWMDSECAITTKEDPDDNAYFTIGFHTKTADKPTVNIPVMTVTANTSNKIVVKEVAQGSGTNDRQRITETNANGGYFRLRITIGDTTNVTPKLPWDITAGELQTKLTNLALFKPEDLSVKDIGTNDPNQNFRYTVTFKKKFGDVPLMVADYEDTLECNVGVLPPVEDGPYKYPTKNFDDIDLSCQTGPLLRHPGEGDPAVEIEPCCDELPDELNVANSICIDRDLFDPNQKTSSGNRFTIRDLALIKGLNPNNYSPYVRDFATNTLIETSYSTPVDTKMSVLLIENELDTTGGKTRIINHIKSHREILPARFVWPECDPIRSDLCWPNQ